MNSNIRNYKHLFDGYLRGNLSKDDETKLIDWLNSSGGNYQLFKEYIAENQFAQFSAEETNMAWQKLKSKIKIQNSINVDRKLNIPNWIKIAAVILVALFTGFYSNQLVHRGFDEIALNEIVVPKGEKAQVVLSDGTNVFLNAGSRLKYPAIFSKKNREVVLTGEAFFDVAKDKSHPFIIGTPKFNVKVTGTSFNLKAYQDDEENNLTLHSGEVLITKKGKEYKVLPGERFIYNMRTQKSEIALVDVQKSFLWNEGVIVIDDLNLEEIRKILERRFDVQISIINIQVKKIRYTGQFKPHETLEEILDLIQAASPVKFKYEINETKNVITIK